MNHEIVVPIVRVESDHIVYDGEEAHMEDAFGAGLLRVGPPSRRLLARPALLMPCSITAYGAGYAEWRVVAGEQHLAQTHPLHPNSLRLSSQAHAEIFRETVSRYRSAHECGSAVPKVRDTDESVLALNGAAWNLSHMDARVYAFPDSGADWEIVPTDPALLRCLAADDVEEFVIDRATINGAYTTGSIEDDLFDGSENPVDIIIRIEHDLCQIRHRMTLADAQQLGIRRQRISCRARRRNGGVAELVGGLALTRGND